MTIVKLAKSIVPGPIKPLLHGLIRNYRSVKARAKIPYERLMCRYYYGNTVQYWANVKGTKDWAAARNAFGGSYDSELHRHFMKLGYANLSSAADMTLIKSMQRSFQAVILDPNLSFNPFADPESLKYYNHGNYQGPLGEYRRHITDTRTAFPGHAALLHDRLAYMIQSCLGSHFAIESVHAYRNTYCPPHIVEHFEPHASRWHFDDQIADGMRLFVYLTDVTDNHGPFQCFDRGYSRYLLRKGFSKEARKFSVTGGLPAKLYDTPRLKSHTGPAGTMVLCASSYCLHRAGDMLGAGNYRDVFLYNLRPSLTALGSKPVLSAAA